MNARPMLGLLVITTAALGQKIQWTGPGSNGHYYEATTSAGSWDAANAEATSRGGYLATITSSAEQAFINNTFGFSDIFWIGLKANAPFQFYWITGEPLVYTDWASGEPSNGNCSPTVLCEGAGSINRYPSGQWNDASSSISYRAIIEYDVQLNCNPTTGPTKVGTPYSATCTAPNGTAPYTWGILPDQAALPAGLSLIPNGTTATISGTPTTPGNYNYTVQVTDSSTPTPQTAQQAYSGTVAGGPAPVAAVTPSEIDLGWSPLTPGPRISKLTIKNSGPVGSTLTGSISTPMPPFSFVPGGNGTSFTLDSGSTYVVAVAFQGTQVSAFYSDHIAVTSNDPINPTITVPLTGRIYNLQSPNLVPYGQFYYLDCNTALGRSPYGACKDPNNNVEIDPVWVKQNTTVTTLQPGCGQQRVNNAAIASFQSAFALIAADSTLTSDLKECDGVFAERYISGSTVLSHHSWGIAIDLNSSTNLPGNPNSHNCFHQGCPGIPSAENINLWNGAFKPTGFFWGVDFKPLSASDPMHFDLITPIGH